ncbi:MAG: uncharacterized protein QOG49_244 [Frankiaceae bacterium]|nr:uncharacterized protein [Frankiaceae bacterium]
MTLAGLPFPISWAVPPVDLTYAGDGVLAATAGPRTDLFTHPSGAERSDNAPRAHAVPPVGDFAFSARIDVGFASAYDAGVLLLWAAPSTWAKLCFEYSPQGDPMVVSVVTRGASDDANAFVVSGSSVWLRICRIGAAYAFHASLDGTRWTFVRHFALESADPLQLGIAVQSPTGDGCAALFSEIRYDGATPADLRDGS